MRNILIIDDEIDFADFVAKACEAPENRIKTCKNSDEARSAFNDFDPDLVILDIVMPGQDGIEFLQWVAGQGSGAQFILVTGYNPHYMEMAEKLSTLSGLQIVTTIQKPVPLTRIRDEVQKCFAD